MPSHRAAAAIAVSRTSTRAFTDRDFTKLHDGGIRGIRFNFVQHLGGTPDMGEFKELVARAAAFGWHVVLHFDAADLLEFDSMLRTLPVPFIIDHMGRVPTKDGLDQEPFKRLLNARAWTTAGSRFAARSASRRKGPPFTDAVPFAQAILEVAADRALWGTDWPHPNIKKHMPNDGDLVDLIPLFMPDPALQRKVLVDNPQRLYGFSS